MSQLSSLYQGLGFTPGVNPFALPSQMPGSTTPLFPTTRTLPNGGGTIHGATPTPPAPAKTPTPVVPASTPTPDAPVIHPDYQGADGSLLPPAEVVKNQAAKLNGGTSGDIPQYAGNQFTEPNQTSAQTAETATVLNNSRNDIATGATDPYGAGASSGIAYTPQELDAIQKAYAGIYDPAINTALAKLDLKQKQDTADLQFQRDQKLAAQKFEYDKALKKIPTAYQAYQIGDPTGNGGGVFTNTQLNKGASTAGLDLATFKALNPAVKNYFVNPPMGKDSTGKSVPVRTIFDQALQDVKNGKSDATEISKEITDSNLPPEVQQYYLDQMPLPADIKQGFMAQIWNAVTGQ